MRKVRVMYKKEGRAVYISHLDIMRTFQRVLTRAGIAVKHTEGFNPHPYISIALPLSLGYSGEGEFLDMVITDEMKNAEIVSRMNATLPEGIEVIRVYENGSPVRNIAFSEYIITLEYDGGVKAGCIDAIAKLLALPEIILMKKSKRGETETNISPLIKSCKLTSDKEKVYINAILAAGNASLNPEYIVKAIEKYIPEYASDFAEFARVNVYSADGGEFR